VQGLFEASPEFIIAQQQLVVVLQEVNPMSAPEPIDSSDARRASKLVQIAPVFAVLSDFEIRKGLGFRQEDGADVAIICPEVKRHEQHNERLKCEQRDRGDGMHETSDYTAQLPFLVSAGLLLPD
jgi:hypothetical protein